MRYSILLLALVVGCSSNGRTTPAMLNQPTGRTAGVHAPPAERLSNLHHPVSTNSAEAQGHFDDGLTYVYAFNHDEAVRSFEKALAADPKMAMAHWGIALALGPNYNLDVDAERNRKAYQEIQKARELAKNAPQVEKDYIETLAERFTALDTGDLKQHARDYSDDARGLMRKYPDDLDAATLAAESMMTLKPWALYDKHYKPVEGTEEIVAILESVLKRDPDHIGANHLYIHAVEASTTPQRALEAAARLPTLAPDMGHLVHMPSHIYARVGDHESATTSNESAVAVDRAYFQKHPEGKGGFYEMMYFPHNIHFCAYANAWQGNYAEAKKWADELYAHASPHVVHMPMVEGFTAVPIGIEIKFRKWDAILASQSPDEKIMPITTAMWHFGRGLAFADRGDLSQARSERDKMLAIKSALPKDAMWGMLNKADHVLSIAQHTIDAKIVARDNKFDEAEKQFRQAVALEDDLTYMEPPDWFLPSRESLGGELLATKQYDKAEKVFREDLERSPRNGRSLFGLMTALKQQGRDYEAGIIERQFKTAWKNADTKLRVEDF